MIRVFFRWLYLSLLLEIFTIGKWFKWEYAEDQCVDLELALNNNFYDFIQELIKEIEEHPEILDDISRFMKI